MSALIKRIGIGVTVFALAAVAYFFIYIYGVPPAVAIPQSWRCDPAAFGAPRDDVLQNVYNPRRLHVLAPCLEVSGRVTQVSHIRDGDWHIRIDVDAQYRPLLNRNNRHGLVVEVVPADQPGCTKGRGLSEPRDDLGVCTGRNIREPSVGRHVTVSGPYLFDTHHGWMEIHPVWSLR